MGYTYTITPEMALYLQDIERVRTAIATMSIPPGAAASLRLKARIRSTHFSTRIEGNRLNLNDVEEAVLRDRKFEGLEKDTGEVQRYYQALDWVEEQVDRKSSLNELVIRKLHAKIFLGKRAQPTPYRDGQNAVRDSEDGRIVYLPPEARDVPGLMQELAEWIRSQERQTPCPILAAMAHYQLVTIHPWYDGNGRTARALATWILYRSGYGLGRMFSLEEAYARDLDGYYAALQTDPQHNYYDGRCRAPVTAWVAYFLETMRSTFQRLEKDIRGAQTAPHPDAEKLLRRMDRRSRMTLGLLVERETITSQDVALLLGLSQRQVRDLLIQWIQDGWLEMADTARKSRKYRLVKRYRKIIGGLSAE